MGLFKDESHPVAERIARRGFYIPSGMALTEAQIEEVVQAVREVLRWRISSVVAQSAAAEFSDAFFSGSVFNIYVLIARKV